jgi:superfamily II DNA/RNA helicase
MGEQIPAHRYIRKAIVQVQQEPIVSTQKYTDFPLHESLLTNIAHKGYAHPTPIQEQAIPHIMAGKDVVGIANTGTGKTGAFLIPTIEKIGHNPQTKALVVVPTRELAEQIQQELTSLTVGIRISSTLVIGGASMHRQIMSLRRHTHFVIGTPGRIKDLIEQKVLNLSTYSVFVLDEVDRMVDMGFIHDIKYLVSLLPPVRQSLFFSATISPEISQVMGAFLKDPVTVRIKSTSSTSDSVNQDVVRIPPGKTKWDFLEPLLKQDGVVKTIIFVRTKRGADDLTSKLIRAGFQAGSIHGDKPQRARQIAIKSFKDYTLDILVATDVAARGIDVPDVTHVINYDEPATYDDYIHRIGRTGRAGKVGQALTFVAG